MKTLLALILIVTSLAFSQPHPADHRFRVAYCTTVYGVDYCNEANYLVRLDYRDGQISIVRTTYGERTLLRMKPNGKWTTDPKTGDTYMNIRIKNETDWKLIAREKAYILVNENCSMIELWHGSRADEHAFHGYVREETFDDIDALTDRCIAEKNRDYDNRNKKRKGKGKPKKYDSGILIMGMAAEIPGFLL